MSPMPTCALLLEDLADVAAWLQALLLDRFPGITVAHAATLAEARRLLDAGCNHSWHWWTWACRMATAPS